jgi:CMP-N-acetylneuraminic acid synthetase
LSITAFIFARGGSKGLPGKNIKPLLGKPLIAWSIEQALTVPGIDRVIVSTDAQEIADIAGEYGAQTPFLRPPELAKDETPEWMVWRHALGFLRETEGRYPDYIVSVPVTSPLRLPGDIAAAIEEYEKHSPDAVVVMTQAHRNPYFNMVRMNDEGCVEIAAQPDSKISRRQDVPKIFDLTTVAYVLKTEFIMTSDSLFEGKVRAVEVPAERAVDIDTQMDFDIAEVLMSKRMANSDH